MASELGLCSLVFRRKTTVKGLRSRIARVVCHRNGEAHDECRDHCSHTTTGKHVCYVRRNLLTFLDLGQNLLPSSAAFANRVEPILSAFPALRAMETLSVESRP